MKVVNSVVEAVRGLVNPGEAEQVTPEDFEGTELGGTIPLPPGVAEHIATLRAAERRSQPDKPSEAFIAQQLAGRRGPILTD